MKFITLQNLFKAMNPDGSIRFNKRAYTIQFEQGQRPYYYGYTSHYDLAERLKLIPVIDKYVLSRTILARLQESSDPVIALSGCGDTIAVYHHKHGGEGRVEEQVHGVDEYGRGLSEYSLARGPSPWTT